MAKKIIVTTVIEQVFEETDGHLELKSDKILKTDVNILGESKAPKTIQFTDTDVRYGIISIGKSHELSRLYNPGESIKISLNGVMGEGKWHNSQCRISSLTKLMRAAKVTQPGKFFYSYDGLQKTIIFEKVQDNEN